MWRALRRFWHSLPISESNNERSGTSGCAIRLEHYNDVIMSTMTSQITSLTIVYPNRWFWRRSKKTSKLCVTGLCVGNSPVTGEFPTQMASNAENVSIWWRHHEPLKYERGETFKRIYLNSSVAGLLEITDCLRKLSFGEQKAWLAKLNHCFTVNKSIGRRPISPLTASLVFNSLGAMKCLACLIMQSRNCPIEGNSGCENDAQVAVGLNNFDRRIVDLKFESFQFLTTFVENDNIGFILIND